MKATLGSELIIARASSAARSGDLDEAERLLRNLEAASGPSPAQLDLLARVHAQRGNLAEADACWARVQATDPANTAAAVARQLIADISSGRRRAQPVIRAGWVSLLAAAFVCAVLIGTALWIGSSVVLSPPGLPDDAAFTRSETQRADDLARQLAALQAERAGEIVRRTAAIDELARGLALPGVRVDRLPDGVQVVFDQGLFVRNDRLIPGGAARLAGLGRHLAGRDVSIVVVGHIVAVPDGPATGGSVVGLGRAIVAARALADSSGLPLTTFTLRSADQTQAPFPDPARNRTVALLISPNGTTR